MAIFTGTIKSNVLDMKTKLTIVTPQEIFDVEETCKVVYLLHGLSDDCGDWYANAQLTLLSNAYNLIFILPEVQRSFYTNMYYGLNYFTYIVDELPKICQKLFNISSKREDTYVMGLSMGGYGALKCALSRPEQYAGCGAFSAACSLADCVDVCNPEQYREFQAVFGPNLELLEENEVMNIAKECQHSAVKPEIFMTCGTEDFIHNQSVKFRDFMKDIDIPYIYQEWPGVHEWYFWNKSLHLACDHFFKRITEENYCNVK